jgi:hypothetical protein
VKALAFASSFSIGLLGSISINSVCHTCIPVTPSPYIHARIFIILILYYPATL